MNSPLISIITVCKNEVSTIENMLNSIFEQSYTNWELIVVDGDSSDGTVELLQKHGQKIKHFVSEPDAGIYNAMNKGIRLASGDFLYFLNANDTIYAPNVFEKIVFVMQKYPDKRLFFGDVNFKSKDNRNCLGCFDKFDNVFMFLSSNLNHQTIFYHKSLFEEFGMYDESFKMLADTDFNIKLLVKERLHIVHCPLVVSNFQLGGFSSDFLIYKKEHRIIINRYYRTLYVFKNLYKMNLTLKYFCPNLVKKMRKNKSLVAFYIKKKNENNLNLIVEKMI